MPAARSRRRWSPTRYFVVVSVVAMLALGAALIWVASSVMGQQSLRDGTSSATSVQSFAVGPLPAEAFGTEVLTPEQTDAVRDSTSRFSSRLVDLRLWNTDGLLMYSGNDDATTGFPDGARFDAVKRTGEPEARVITDVRGVKSPQSGARGTQREVLDVYVPVRVRDTAGAQPDSGLGPDTVIGVAEVMLDHEESANALQHAVRTVALVVGGGLLLLWLLLFRAVRTTSNRLQATAMENARLALLDSLTGLPNRRLLNDRMRHAIEEAEADGTSVGLVLLDIDRFKDINDSLGHDRGDELLEQVAARLRSALREDDIVARLGGDEFAILLPDVRTVQNAARLAERVRTLFVPPFTLGEMPLHVDTSIGVACLPDHASDASSLMRMADVAMYAAKHHRTGIAVYSADEDDSSPSRLVLLGDLHRALDLGPDEPPQLALHYQPKIDLETGRTVGHEALMRWNHPTRGMLMPGTFITLAEQSGLIHDVTKFALRECVGQLARWREQGSAAPVAVNLSAHDVATATVVDVIEELLAQHGVPAELLEVEITETALVADRSRVVPVLERLGELGVRVAIDDFGIGNTSISQLRDLPVDALKIDRLFVADLAEGGRDSSEVVVQAMVDLAHSFELRVIAEGVEDRPTADILRRLGVDEAQGFLYAAALPADEVRPTRNVPQPRRGSPARRSTGATAVAVAPAVGTDLAVELDEPDHGPDSPADPLRAPADGPPAATNGKPQVRRADDRGRRSAPGPARRRRSDPPQG
ncbi:putative bifunctional diguanylate cyclase/phosphodiesterase [Cellulomonas alba]|uniref:EAL domain-containing protein n=1 Tax=Cellulomonas alba TaxID=3053467 RepID=A0ABT7SED4_9CELL|nr:EAL domain-containing protein [Cellulomonas alba]MDM7854491.1 EAL domain-containing protein [Cellulomonas alba]